MSKPSLHLIYIPGLGDRYDPYRQRALKRWQSDTVHISMISMQWRDRDETYEQKVRRVRTLINESSIKRIVLVGESAGGSVVVAELLRDSTLASKGITICGKNARSDRVSPYLYINNPALRDAVSAADEAIENTSNSDKAKNLTLFHSPLDAVIHKVDTYVPGAKLRHLFTPGHIISIFIVLFFLKRMIIKESMKDNL